MGAICSGHSMVFPSIGKMHNFVGVAVQDLPLSYCQCMSMPGVYAHNNALIVNLIVNNLTFSFEKEWNLRESWRKNISVHHREIKNWNLNAGCQKGIPFRSFSFPASTFSFCLHPCTVYIYIICISLIFYMHSYIDTDRMIYL